MNSDPSIQFLQGALNQYYVTNTAPNAISVDALLNQFANANNPPAPIPPPLFPSNTNINPFNNQNNQINLTQNKNDHTVISNRKYSLIIDYWFRTTKPYTITDNDNEPDHESKSNSVSGQAPNKEKGISKMITDYCTPIFRVLPIPKQEHGYGGLPTGPTIYTKPEQWNTFINGIVTSGQRMGYGSHYNNKQGVLNGLLSAKYPINWDEEFVVLITSHHGSPPQSIQFKADEYEINKDNNSLIVTIEIDNGRSDTGSCCVMAYYAFCIVVNKLRGFEKIGVKSRSISTSVPQCNSILPTDDLATINRKTRQHYANLTPNDYVRNVYEGIIYQNVNGYNDPFAQIM